MKITPIIVKIAQLGLNKHYYQSLIVDGDPGPATDKALLAVLLIPTHWKKDRKIVAMVQIFASYSGFEVGPVDGYWGPQTEQAFEDLKVLTETRVTPKPWRDDEGEGGETGGEGWPLQTQAELEKFYGPVGSNQGKVRSPYPLKIAWDTSKIITKFSCHNKVVTSVERVLERVLTDYGLEEIQRLGLDLWGGCLNVRKMRGGTKYSTHSWGCAIDWDPSRNKLRWKADKASFAKPVYDKWWSAWESEGWVSLGRARGYDWMHAQASRVK